MSIKIQKPGMLDTIQDLGRTGKGMYGISPGGAMDQYAAEMANNLAGNAQHEAVIEMHYPGPQILFERDALISITGGDFTPFLNNQPLPCWQPIAVRRNTSLHFTDLKWGARAYLGIHGGLAMERWLDSYSTHLKAGMGGWMGRKLEKGDELPIRMGTFNLEKMLSSPGDARIFPWKSAFRNIYEPENDIFFIRGQEWTDLEEAVKADFLKTSFTIQPSSDRMGYQLHGDAVIPIDKKEILSSAVTFGTLQLLPGGQLIVLMADHQTTGGYPRLGHVISAHLPKLAQLSPGASIRFIPLDILTAENLFFSQHRQLKVLQRACMDHLNDVLC